MTTKLKPCPFCGGKATIIKRTSIINDIELRVYGCMNPPCPIRPFGYFKKSWNTRAK